MEASAKALTAGALALAAIGGTAVPSPRADAGSYTQTDERHSYWGAGATLGHERAYIRAYSSDYGCGLQDCGLVRDMHGSMDGYKDGDQASLPNAVKMRLVAAFGGVNVSVGLGASAGGVSGGVSFHDLGSSCGTDDVQNSGDAISIEAPGSVCQASTYGWVSNIDVSTGGLFRRGTAWTALSAFDRVSVGGL